MEKSKTISKRGTHRPPIKHTLPRGFHLVKTHKRKKIIGEPATGKKSKFDITDYLFVTCGGILSPMIDKLLGEKMDNKLKQGIKMAVGVALPMFMPGTEKMKHTVRMVGVGLFAVSTKNLLTDLNVLKGIGIFPEKNKTITVLLPGGTERKLIQGTEYNKKILAMNTISKNRNLLAMNTISGYQSDEDELD